MALGDGPWMPQRTDVCSLFGGNRILTWNEISDVSRNYDTRKDWLNG